MDFSLTEEHIMIRDAARDFAQTELLPGVIERDNAQKFPDELVRKMGELGFMGIMVDPKYGGSGLDAISYVLIMEELSKIDASASVMVSVNNSLVCYGIEAYGTEEQKQKYLTKQLSNILGIELIRFDMSEYMERHTVSRLIGAPPGYVGFDQGGLLTEAIVKTPHCVLLLDEIEKAHPDIFNILLQVMDAGVLTDNNGRKSDFRNVILIMTTNIGAELLSKRNIGFNESSNETDAMNSLNKLFSPEFRNRLDETIQFSYLDKKVILSIVDKFLTKLQAQLDKRNVEVVVSKKVIEWIAENGYDKEMGARPMERFISQNIKKPLVDKLLFGNLKSGGVIKLDLEKGKLKFTESKNKVKV